jgi:tetratricopeptide (TPR) repeat protein
MGLARWIVQGRWLFLVVLTAFFWQGNLRAAPSPLILRSLRLGQYRNASATIFKSLEANPDDWDLHALHGTVLSRAGLYADALAPFEFAEGSFYYENEGLFAHADALRETGETEAAAALRSERLVTRDLEEGDELIIVLGLAEDYTRMGDMDRAYTLYSDLLAMWPNSPSVHGCLAEFYLDMGDLESAEFHLWYVTEVLGLRHGLRGMFAQFRIHVAQFDYREAQEVMDQALGLRRQSLRVRAWQAELIRLQGDPADALSMVQAPRYWFQQHPEMKAVEALSLFETGRDDEAKELGLRLQILYPGHPAVDALGLVLQASED